MESKSRGKRQGFGFGWEGECAVRGVLGRKETQGIIEIKVIIKKMGLCFRSDQRMEIRGRVKKSFPRLTVSCHPVVHKWRDSQGDMTFSTGCSSHSISQSQIMRPIMLPGVMVMKACSEAAGV